MPHFLHHVQPPALHFVPTLNQMASIQAGWQSAICKAVPTLSPLLAAEQHMHHMSCMRTTQFTDHTCCFVQEVDVQASGTALACTFFVRNLPFPSALSDIVADSFCVLLQFYGLKSGVDPAGLP